MFDVHLFSANLPQSPGLKITQSLWGQVASFRILLQPYSSQRVDTDNLLPAAKISYHHRTGGQAPAAGVKLGLIVGNGSGTQVDGDTGGKLPTAHDAVIQKYLILAAGKNNRYRCPLPQGPCLSQFQIRSKVLTGSFESRIPTPADYIGHGKR